MENNDINIFNGCTTRSIQQTKHALKEVPLKNAFSCFEITPGFSTYESRIFMKSWFMYLRDVRSPLVFLRDR